MHSNLYSIKGVIQPLGTQRCIPTLAKPNMHFSLNLQEIWFHMFSAKGIFPSLDGQMSIPTFTYQKVGFHLDMPQCPLEGTYVDMHNLTGIDAYFQTWICSPVLFSYTSANMNLDITVNNTGGFYMQFQMYKCISRSTYVWLHWRGCIWTDKDNFTYICAVIVTNALAKCINEPSSYVYMYKGICIGTYMQTWIFTPVCINKIVYIHALGHV